MPPDPSLNQRLRIAEMFESLQGEGSRIGVPSLFVRVSGCSLRCTWCDTPYASWSPEGPVQTVSAILKEVRKSKCPDVVVTGGEPMIFDAVVPLVEELKQLGKFVTIETAGIAFQELPADLMSISPKLSNSVPVGTKWEATHERIRADRRPLKLLTERYESQLKFVVQPPVSTGDDRGAIAHETAEIDAILADLPFVRPDQVFLMPEGRSQQVLWDRARQLVPLCLERGWRLAPRIQIDLFGDTKGT